MKTAIIYYSFSGNTRRLVKFLRSRLSQAGTVVELNELKPVKEARSFFQQGSQAAAKARPALLNPPLDLNAYDFLIFAGPVWAFTVCPALRTFIGLAVGLEGKKSAGLVTCGSEAPMFSRGGLKDLEAMLTQAGANIIFSRAIAGIRCANEKYLTEKLRDLFAIISSPLPNG